MDVLVIGAGGTIGSTVAYTLSVVNPASNIILTDTRSAHTEGHTIDMRHSMSHVAHAIGRPSFDDTGSGSIRTEHPDSALVDAVDYIVVTASAPRPEGGAERGGRMAFLEQNLEIADDVASWLRPAEPKPTIVVSNPLDRILHRLWERTEWPRRSFIGYSLSETARIADKLARLTNTPVADVYCPILGEHGEHIVPVFSRATVGGEPLELTAAEEQAVVDYVREVPYEVIGLRGPTDGSRWVTGRGIVTIIERLHDVGTSAPVCLSTPLAGEYGFEDVSLSVPATLDSDGIREIIEWDLSPNEQAQLDRAYEAIIQ